MFTPKKPPMENGKISLKDQIEEKREKFRKKRDEAEAEAKAEAEHEKWVELEEHNRKVKLFEPIKLFGEKLNAEYKDAKDGAWSRLGLPVRFSNQAWNFGPTPTDQPEGIIAIQFGIFDDENKPLDGICVKAWDKKKYHVRVDEQTRKSGVIDLDFSYNADEVIDSVLEYIGYKLEK